jgi:hypothetical protein
VAAVGVAAETALKVIRSGEDDVAAFVVEVFFCERFVCLLGLV